MIRIRAVIFFMVLGVSLAAAPSSYCKEGLDKEQLKTIQGTISDLNWVRSTITVRWMEHARTMRYDEITIFVPQKTKILRGSDIVMLSTLNIFDRVTVVYHDDPANMGPLQAVSIRVMK